MTNPNLKEPDIFSIRDIIDSQLESRDNIELSRVDDIEITQQEDGTFVLTTIIIGPQALAKRTARPLYSVFRFLLHDRFEYSISLNEVESFGPTLRLRRDASDYSIGYIELWIAKHILRWIPGSGFKWRKN
jgi:hypothetical protein